MAKAFAGPSLVVLGAVLALAGCSPAPVAERLPTELGGLPAGTPTAPTAPYRYPAVHDTPPPRDAAPLTDEQQLELEQQLQKARKKQESQATGMKDTQDAMDKAAK
jgi:hypothetical protein